MLRAAPEVAPDIEKSSLVDPPAIEVFPIVKVRSAPAAIETVVKVTDPTRPLQFTVPEAAPDPVTTGKLSPFPAVEETRFPLVAVMFPRVAVTVVPADTDPRVAEMFPADAVMFPRVATMFPEDAVTPPVVAVTPVPATTVVPADKLVVVVNEPGVVIATGRDTIADPVVGDTVTWFAVPVTELTTPVPPKFAQLAVLTLGEITVDSRVHREFPTYSQKLPRKYP